MTFTRRVAEGLLDVVYLAGMGLAVPVAVLLLGVPVVLVVRLLLALVERL